MASVMTSVWEKTDNEFLRTAIPFYLRSKEEIFPLPKLRILDATFGLGVFWKDSYPKEWTVYGMDADKTKRPTLYGDNRSIPVRGNIFDVVIYDPPYVTHGWSKWDESYRYGSAEGYGSISYLFPSFLDEAERVLRTGGIVIAKLANQIHSGRFFDQVCEFKVMAQTQFTLCNEVIKIRSAARPQPAGRRQLHAEQRHSYYVILRKGAC